MKRKLTLIIISMFMIIQSPGSAEEFLSTPVSKEKMKLLPVPADFRNYFLLHSVDNDTSVLIGDFTGSERFLSQITDVNSDNTVDRVTEYFPDSQKFKIKMESSSQYAGPGWKN